MTLFQPLRLLHVAKFFPPDLGGMEKAVGDLALAQAAEGHQVLVLAHAGCALAGEEKVADRLRVRRYRVWFSVGRGYAPVAPGLLGGIIGAGHKFKPDIIHLHCPNLASLPWTVLPAKAGLILHWHAEVVFPQKYSPPAWQLRLWRRIEARLIQRADQIVVTSPDYLAASEPLANFKNKCRIIPLFLPLEPPLAQMGPAAHWMAKQKPGRRILAVGRLSHYKGFPVLLKAVAQIEEASLCLIGQGEQFGLLQSMIDSLKLKQRVWLGGEVDDGDREAALALADIFCLPSLDRSEAFGLSLVEAMRAGRPCVATKIPGSGLNFVVDDGVTGLLATPDDPASLAATLGILLSNPAYAKSLGQAGRSRFLEKFTPEKALADTNRMYYEVLTLKRLKEKH